MPNALLDQTNWGKLLLDAQSTVRGLNVVESSRVRITRRLPALIKQIATPCIAIKPLAKRARQSTNNPIGYDYSFSIAYIKAAPDGSASESLPDELVENEKFWEAFHLTRGWANNLGGAMILSEMRESELSLEEAEQLSFAAQYFIVNCQVDEMR